jgi:hypothetical protein
MSAPGSREPLHGRITRLAFGVTLGALAVLWIHAPAHATRSVAARATAVQHTSLLPDSLFSALRVGSHRIRLNSVMSLAKVRALLGPAPIVKRPSEDAPEYVRCYRTTDSPARYLRVIAWPNLNEVIIVDFTSLDSTATADAKCRPLGLPASSIGMTNGLRLGTDSARVRQLLGTPTRRQLPTWMYESDRDTLLGSSVTHDLAKYGISGQITLRFRRGVIVKINISQNTQS